MWGYLQSSRGAAGTILQSGSASAPRVDTAWLSSGRHIRRCPCSEKGCEPSQLWPRSEKGASKMLEPQIFSLCWSSSTVKGQRGHNCCPRFAEISPSHAVQSVPGSGFSQSQGAFASSVWLGPWFLTPPGLILYPLISLSVWQQQIPSLHGCNPGKTPS